MKNILLTIALSALFIFCSVSLHAASGNVDIVFFGDSITETHYLAADQRIEAVISKQLLKAYPQQNIRLHNVSKGGSTIASFMKKGSTYDSKCASVIKNINICFIQFGVNDEDKFTPEEFSHNMNNMCERILKDFPQARIILCTSMGYMDLDWYKRMGKGATESISKKYYEQTRLLAKKRGIPLADIYQAQSSAREAGNWDMQIRNQKLSRMHYQKVIIDNSKDTERVADGIKWLRDVHPNANGVVMQAACMTETLNSAFPKSLPSK